MECKKHTQRYFFKEVSVWREWLKVETLRVGQRVGEKMLLCLWEISWKHLKSPPTSLLLFHFLLWMRWSAFACPLCLRCFQCYSFFRFVRQPSGRRVTFLVLKVDLVTHREMMLNGGRILMVVVQLKGLVRMTVVELPIFLASPTVREHK